MLALKRSNAFDTACQHCDANRSRTRRTRQSASSCGRHRRERSSRYPRRRRLMPHVAYLAWNDLRRIRLTCGQEAASSVSYKANKPWQSVSRLSLGPWSRGDTRPRSRARPRSRGRCHGRRSGWGRCGSGSCCRCRGGRRSHS